MGRRHGTAGRAENESLQQGRRLRPRSGSTPPGAVALRTSEGTLLTQSAERTRHFVTVANSDGRRMGRYKDYREPRRRGYEDDFTLQDRAAERGPSNSRPSPPHASELVEAVVKWFNVE